MNKFLIFILVFGTINFKAQFSSLGKFEKRWALANPFASIKVKKISKKCYTIYTDSLIRKQLDKFENGGKLDAFRHVFFMAAFSQKISTHKLRKLGKAHEQRNYRDFINQKKEFGEQADSISSVMDLKNNELGFLLGKQNKKMSLQDLAQKIITEMNLGNTWVMKRNSEGNYLNCNNEIIDLNKFAGKWNVPKCLVKSNVH